MGAFGDLSRINTNVQSLDALRQYHKTNDKIGLRQLRLATGSRINNAEDDSAGYTISKKLEARVRGQAQALSNVGDAKSMLTVAEGAYSNIMDMLQTMKEKAVQAANDTLGTVERADIEEAVEALAFELDDVVGDTKFNSITLFSSGTRSFQVNSDAGDTFAVSVGTLSATQLGLTTTSIDLSSASAASTMISVIDSAISTIADRLGDLGDSQKRLSFKQDQLSVSMNNNEAARSRIADADFAKEQMQLAKLQILQQTGTSALSQANANAQGILQLLG